jgi:hypothetical protein
VSLNHDLFTKVLISKKQFNKEDVIDCLVITLKLLIANPQEEEYRDVHLIRQQLEMILIDKQLNNWSLLSDYKKEFEEINPELGKVIFAKLEQ